MRLVLRLNTWLVMSHLAVLSLPLLALIGTGALANDLRMQTREDLEHQGALVALHAVEEMNTPTHLSDVLVQAKAATLAGIRVVDGSGVVIASSGDGVGEDLSDEEEVAKALEGSAAMVVRARPQTRARQQPLSAPSRHASVRIFVAVPIREGSATVGAVVLSRTPREEVQAFYEMMPRLSIGVAFALLGTVGLAFAAGRFGSRSLTALSAASERIATGGGAEALAAPMASHIAETAAVATAMAAMSARLRARLAYIREFAGNVSHEFKTPVSSLRGTVELLRDDDAMPPEQRARFLDNALSDLDRLSRLVGGLLQLARAEEGGQREAVPLDVVTAGLAARHEGIHYEVGAGTILGSREQVDAALENLLENALRHGGAKIEVRGWTMREQTGVDVIDDGPGISPANLPHIFDRFFTTDRERGGTGLGLALVRAVAEAHGGTVTVESRAGRTCFRLSLPLASTAPTAARR